MNKAFFATLLCAMSIPCFAAFSHFKTSDTAPVLTVNFIKPTTEVVTFVDLQINQNDLGVQKISSSNFTMYLSDNGIGKAVSAGILSLTKPNEFNFYQCSDNSCTTKTLAQQTTHSVSISKHVPSPANPNSYIANPSKIIVTLK